MVAAVLAALTLTWCPPEGLGGISTESRLLLRNAAPSALLGRRDFRAHPLLATEAESGRLPRDSHLSEDWLRLGVVELAPRAQRKLALPFEASIRLARITADLGLKIDLGETADGVECLVLDSSRARDNGIFVERSGVRHGRLRDERLRSLCDTADLVQLDLHVGSDAIHLRCGSDVATIPYALEGTPILRVAGASERHVPAIDHVQVRLLDGDGRPRRSFDADFRVWPARASPGQEARLAASPPATGSLCLTLILSLALDALLLAFVRRRAVLEPAWGLLQLAWLPAQIALAVAATQAMRGAVSGPLVAAVLLFGAKLALAHLFTRAPVKVGGPMRMGLQLAGLVVLVGFAAYTIAFETAWFTGFSRSWAAVAALAPIGVMASSWLLGRRCDAVLLAMAACQLLLYPLVWYAAPLAHPLSWAGVALTPWAAANLLSTRRLSPAVGWWRTAASTLLALVSLFVLVECGLRADIATDLGLWSRHAMSETESILLRQLRVGWGRANGETDPRWDGLAFATRLHPFSKPLGAFRIVCLGSSTTWGVGVDDPARDGYPAQLEHRLQQRQTRTVEVINAGVPGATLDALYVLTSDLLLAMGPDLVVLYFGINGETPGTLGRFADLRAKVGRHPGLDRSIEMKAAADLRWSPPWLVSCYLALGDLRVFRLAASARPSPVASARDRATSESTVARDLAAACAAHHVPLLLIPEVLRTDLERGAEGHPYYGIFAELDRTDDAGVQYLDLRDRLSPLELEPTFIDSVHLTRDGYALVADAIASHLVQQGLVPIPDAPTPRPETTPP